MNMATTRRMLTGGVCGLLCAGALLAQRPGGPRGDRRQMMEQQAAELKKRLKLSDEQETKMRAVLVESGKKRMALREKYGQPEPGQTPPAGMMAEMKKIREQNRAAIEKILTAEQMKEYEKIERERLERFRGGKGGTGANR